MASLNKVFLMGNLTRDPELRYLPNSGSAVCEFGLAINRRFVSKGQDKEETCFVDLVVWGKQAETCDRFLKKGSPALIEGRLQLDQWEDRETGKPRSKMRVVAERVQFMSGSRSEDDQAYGGPPGQGAAPYQQQQQRPPQGGYPSSTGYDNQAAPPPPRQWQNAPAAGGGDYAPAGGGGYAPPPQQRPDDQRQAPPPAEAPAPSEPFQVDDETEDDIPF